LVVAVLAIAAAYEWWRGRAPASGGGMGTIAPAQTPSAPLAPEATAPAQTTIPLSPERVTDAPGAPAGEGMQPSEAGGGGVAPQAPAAAPESPTARGGSSGVR